MNELEAKVVLDLTGNLQRRADLYADSLKSMSQKGERSLGRLRRSMSYVERGLDRFANRWVGIATGAGAIATGRMLVTMEERMERLGMQASISTDAVNNLKRKIFELSQDDKIRVDYSEMLSAIELIVEKTGDLDFARKNIENIGLAISGTGAAGSAVGEIFAEYQKTGIVDPRTVRQVTDLLTVQGKQGAFTLQNLAQLGPRIVQAYAANGRQGIGAMRELGAVMQVIRQGSGSAEQAATSFESYMRVFGDAKKVKLLQSAGIKVFEPGSDDKVIRSAADLMKDIVKFTGGKKTLLSQVFEADSMKAFNAVIAEYNRTGSFESLDKFLGATADGSTLLNDSARAAGTSAAAVRSLYVAWVQFADGNLTQPIKDLANAVNNIEPGALQDMLETAKNIAITLGAIYTTYKLITGAAKAVDAVRTLRGKKGSLAGAASGLKPIPVFVVNAGALGGLGGFDGLGKTRKGSGLRRLLGRGAPLAGGVAGGAMAGGAGTLMAAGGELLAAGVAGWEIGSLINSQIEGTKFHDSVGRVVASFLAGMGNEEAKASLEREREAKLLIEVEDKRVRVRRPRSKNMNVEATGPAMGDLG